MTQNSGADAPFRPSSARLHAVFHGGWPECNRNYLQANGLGEVLVCDDKAKLEKLVGAWQLAHTTTAIAPGPRAAEPCL